MKIRFVDWRSQRAYTLIELLLAMALFVALAGGLGYGIIRAVNAHNFETSYREAALQARTVLDQMVEELRVASIPNESQALGNNEYAIASSLWFPDPYDGKQSQFGSFYKLDTDERTETISGSSGKPTEKKKIYGKRGYNRLVFSRPDPSTSGKYVFVDWFIPSNKRDRIYRVAHNLDTNAVPYKFDNTADKYTFKSPTTYFGNGTSLGTNLTYVSSNAADFTVAQLPHSYDTFCFAVELEPNDSVYAGASSGVFATCPDENNACYSTELARITVKAVVHANADAERAEEDGDPYVKEVSASNRGAGHKRAIVVSEQAYINN